MSNSNLVSYTKLSPNHSGQRTHAIDRITPHCVVGQCSVETLGSIFAPSSRQASCNYGIGSDGRIGMYVEEKNRSWCSSSNANDQRAVTIECASGLNEPYWMNDQVYNALIRLCVDICKRNGKKKLIWFADKNKSLNYSPKSDEMVLTVHRWFANKSCPGDWLYSRLGDLASKVTSQLGGTSTTANVSSYSGNVKVGDIITLISGAKYSNGKNIPAWVIQTPLYVREIKKDGTIIISTKASGAVTGVINKNQIKTVKTNASKTTSNNTSSTATSYKVQVTASALNIRKGPNTSYGIAGVIRDKGIYTIVQTNNGWGKLKSGAGWISLAYTQKV